MDLAADIKYIKLSVESTFENVSPQYILAYTLQLYLNKNILDIRRCFKIFEDYLLESQPNINISDVYNTYIHNWFYGNILTYIYNLIFKTYDYIDLHFETERPFIHDCIIIIYRLLTVYKVKEESLYDYMIYLQNSQTYFHIDYDQFVLLRTLSKHEQHFNVIPRDLLRIKLARMRVRKKRAVQIIEDWWFNIVSDPDTLPGKRLLRRRADRFLEYYNSI